jgi:hypothetical protein
MTSARGRHRIDGSDVSPLEGGVVRSTIANKKLHPTRANIVVKSKFTIQLVYNTRVSLETHIVYYRSPEIVAEQKIVESVSIKRSVSMMVTIPIIHSSLVRVFIFYHNFLAMKVGKLYCTASESPYTHDES